MTRPSRIVPNALAAVAPTTGKRGCEHRRDRKCLPCEARDGGGLSVDLASESQPIDRALYLHDDLKRHREGSS